ncbi:MAG: ATP-binding protein [Gemmatimonadota bacterium]
MNPFKIHGVVEPPAFTNREAELRRIRATLAEPGAKLLVYGERRMGKTSALRVAMAEHEAAGGLSCLADFSTATSHADLANRILGAATRTLGRRWRDVALELAGRMGVRLEAGFDAGTGLPTASLGLGVREGGAEAQRQTLAAVLDGLEDVCRQRNVALGLVLDEFQEIHSLGGEEAEWHLRGIIQHHRHLSYVVAGSRTHLIRRMLEKGRAFYKLFDVLAFGTLQEDHFTSWIEERMALGGVAADGAGRSLVELAGPRTRDVVQLARKAFELGSTRTPPAVDPEVIRNAFVEVVQDESDPLQALWRGYAAAQQNVLRAVAAGTEMLTAASTLKRFGLRSSAAASQAAAALVDQGALEFVAPGHYRFDSPFQRGWVILNALPDLGMHVSPTHQGEHPG